MKRFRRFCRLPLLSVGIAAAAFAITFVCLSIHSFQAPFQYFFAREKMGRRLGSIPFSNGDRQGVFEVFSSKRLGASGLRVTPCLMLRPVSGSGRLIADGCRLVRRDCLKITPESIGIFNCTWTEFLPLGGYVFESDMTYPVYSLDDDLKGWNAEFTIRHDKDAVEYTVFPSGCRKELLRFKVPRGFFGTRP